VLILADPLNALIYRDFAAALAMRRVIDPDYRFDRESRFD
jgi:hypothetical protein